MMIRETAEDIVLRNGPDGDSLLHLKRGTRVIVRVDMIDLRAFKVLSDGTHINRSHFRLQPQAAP